MIFGSNIRPHFAAVTPGAPCPKISPTAISCRLEAGVLATPRAHAVGIWVRNDEVAHGHVRTVLQSDRRLANSDRVVDGSSYRGSNDRSCRRRLHQALDAALNVDKVRTGDIGGKSTTAEFTKALVGDVVQPAAPAVA